MKQLIKLLLDYDSYYAMTDDPRRFDEGLAHENKLLEEVKKYELHEMLSYLESLKIELITLKNKS